MKLAYSEDYIQCIKENPIHSNVLNCLMVSYPTPLYQSENKPGTYERDNEKFEQMMEKYGFMKLLEDNQKFMMETTLPYVKAKKSGKLSNEQAKEYKDKYLAHLQTMKEGCKKIQSVDFNDKLVKGNKTVVTNTNIELRWINEFSLVEKKIDKMQNALGNGWPTRDYGTLVEIMEWYELNQHVANDPEANPAKQQEAKEAIEGSKEAYEALFSTKVDSLPKREALLKDIKNKIEKYDETSPVSVMIEDTLAAPIQTAEIGIISTKKNVEYDDFVVVNDKYGINTTHDSLNESLTELDNGPKPVAEAPEVKTDEKKGVEAFSTKAMKKQVDEIYKAMKGVDYFMFGKSSDQFNNMMDAITEMKKQMDTMAQYGDTPKPDSLAVFGDLVMKSRNNVIKYLNKKEQDFRDDGSRRDSKDGQKSEQNRIENSINSFEKLTKIYNTTKRTLNGALDKTSTAEVRGIYKQAVKEKAKKNEEYRSMDEYREALLSKQRKQEIAKKQQAPQR